MVEHRQVVERFHKAFFQQHDAGAAAQVYTEDATLVDPTTPGTIKGRAAIEENLASYLRAFPNISARIDHVFGADNWIATEFVIKGTNTGPLEMGPGNTIPPTGKPMEMRVCWIARMTSDGLCAEDRTYYDSASLMDQLGLTGQ